MSKVLDVTDAEVTNNADWLHKMSFTELLKTISKSYSSTNDDSR